MTYRQITSYQRYTLSVLRQQQLNQSEIAKALGVHRSTISRELARRVLTAPTALLEAGLRWIRLLIRHMSAENWRYIGTAMTRLTTQRFICRWVPVISQVLLGRRFFLVEPEAGTS